MMRAGALALALAGCTTVTEAPYAPGLYGDAEGLQPAGTPLRIDFGRAQAGTVAAVTRLLGDPPSSSIRQRDCGGTFISSILWDNGLILNFREDSFVGWVSTADGRMPIGLASGLAPGRPLSELPANIAASRQAGTSSADFSVDGVSGALSGGRVDRLWAGAGCLQP